MMVLVYWHKSVDGSPLVYWQLLTSTMSLSVKHLKEALQSCECFCLLFVSHTAHSNVPPTLPIYSNFKISFSFF